MTPRQELATTYGVFAFVLLALFVVIQARRPHKYTAVEPGSW